MPSSQREIFPADRSPAAPILAISAMALLLAAQTTWGQTENGTDPPLVHWPRRDFVIPFQIDPAGEVPAEIRLEVSKDRGQSWTFSNRADARQRQFHFQAEQDGEYHFRLKTVDRKGNVYENPGQPLEVVVDTSKPNGELLVDMDPQGRMQAECRMTDEAFDRTSFQLEFQTDINPQWIAVACELQAGSDPGEWFAFGTWEMPEGAAQLVVRATARDRAGNIAEWTRIPRLPRSAGISREMTLASNKELANESKSIGSGIIRLPSPTPTKGAGVAKRNDPNPSEFPRVEVVGGPRAIKPSAEIDRDALLQRSLLESQQRLIEYQNRLLMQKRVTSDVIPSDAMNDQEEPKKEEAIAAPPPPPPPASQSMPAREGNLHTNSLQFSLDYAIDDEFGSAVASVELWGTIDDGVSWAIWGTDADRQSPFDIEVEGDGLFGFRMVIVGANGIASKRPLPSDDADAWVRVDTVAPQARIVSVLKGKGVEAGSLVIDYQASDEFFGERPIAFSWSESPKGPWQPLADGARNNGRYVWTPDSGLPPTVYLRIEAIDAAGNRTAHQLDLPVDIQGATPRGRIQGVRPQRP